MDGVRSLELLHYYVALDADIENDMVMAQLIDDRRKKGERRERKFWQRNNWLESQYGRADVMVDVIVDGIVVTRSLAGRE